MTPHDNQQHPTETISPDRWQNLQAAFSAFTGFLSLARTPAGEGEEAIRIIDRSGGWSVGTVVPDGTGWRLLYLWGDGVPIENTETRFPTAADLAGYFSGSRPGPSLGRCRRRAGSRRV